MLHLKRELLVFTKFAASNDVNLYRYTKGFAATDEYKMPPPPVVAPKPVRKKAAPKKAAPKPAAPAKIVAKPEGWVDPAAAAAAAAVAKEAAELKAMVEAQANPAVGAAAAVGGAVEQGADPAPAAAATVPAAAAAAAAVSVAVPAAVVSAPVEENLSEAEWMAKYGPQGTAGMPQPTPSAAAAFPQNAAPSKASGWFGRRLLGRALHVVYSTDPPPPRLIG